MQGVGFRPFIYRLALAHELLGWVENRNDGVLIHVEGPADAISKFINEIPVHAPEAANIFSLENTGIPLKYYKEFSIRKSENTSEEITEISPDIAVCDACLADMKSQKHRLNYPFINCTNCGPRFTIIKDLPYDRGETSMAPFPMCEICNAEYKNILDRRFHAQPVACNQCGPIYQLHHNGNTSTDLNNILELSKELLETGAIIAIKGLGGYHLACDAQNQDAVQRLRTGKNRDGKPFAVMFSEIETLKEFLTIDDIEKKELLSWQRPIMILQNKPGGKKLAPDVSVGFNTTGAMLPYMPFHHLLFEHLKIPVIVLTSGNISDEPIIIDNQAAIDQLSEIADAIITYNRDIYNRTDDSVVFSSNGKNRMIRRSRGFVPSPIHLNQTVNGIFAAGAELVNCFCVGKDKQAIMSQHIGDLKNIESLDFYTESINRFKKLFRIEPELFVHDLHPDYLSTKYVKSIGGKTTGVQHHHAHIASCMAEHKLDEQVIGISLDGVGYGTDRHIWGSEFLLCDLADFERYTHFEYIPQPGGDQATEYPWRMTLSYLYKYLDKETLSLDIPFMHSIQGENADLIIKAIDLGINTPLTSSAGRLFDSVSALIGLCTHSSFHAEAPMRLESVIDHNLKDHYPFTIEKSIKFRELFLEMIRDIQKGKPVSYISAKFHNTIINVIFAVADRMRKDTGIKSVVLSGGTFQNRYLLSGTEKLLDKHGFKVFAQQRVPSNDGGIALGQLLIGARRRKLGTP